MRYDDDFKVATRREIKQYLDVYPQKRDQEPIAGPDLSKPEPRLPIGLADSGTEVKVKSGETLMLSLRVNRPRKWRPERQTAEHHFVSQAVASRDANYTPGDPEYDEFAVTPRGTPPAAGLEFECCDGSRVDQRFFLFLRWASSPSPARIVVTPTTTKSLRVRP